MFASSNIKSAMLFILAIINQLKKGRNRVILLFSSVVFFMISLYHSQHLKICIVKPV